MGSTSKWFSLLIVIILAVSSLIMVESAFAQSVPQFNLNYVDHSYDVPPTYGIDPYTGKSIVTKEGYHVVNKTIDVTVKNQPFTSYKDSNGNYTSLYYNVKFKPHYTDEWQSYAYYPNQGYAKASSSDSTVVSISNGQDGSFPKGGQVDVRVQALIGSETFFTLYNGITLRYFHNGTESGWSNTQTIAIPETSTSTSPTPNPTPTPSVPEFPSWTTLLLLSIVLALTGLVYFKKCKR